MLKRAQFLETLSQKGYPQDCLDTIGRAYDTSQAAHEGQQRSSGEPYFCHPQAVALALAEKNFDPTSIIAGLLHDTVEDTPTSLDDLRHAFGEEVAFLVDGVTKISRLELQSREVKQAENFRKLVLSLSQDIRVLIIKLADRAHNMETLHHLPKEARQRVAYETMSIYVPLSERMGIRDWKEKLEDLAFQTLYPSERDDVIQKLKRISYEGETFIKLCTDKLLSLFHDPKPNITGRFKTPYSVWRKMRHRQIPFETLSDIMAFRIIVDSVEECYRALGLIHSHYSLLPGRFKDYISLLKPNGYQSIHTGVIGPQNQRIEIQIRTQAMHEVAELGVAAHWQYKQGSQPIVEGKKYRWVRDMLDILSNISEAQEFLSHTRIDMFPDQVFVFSPRGDLYSLPRGATPIDFAYAVHTELGHHCASCHVNGRVVPFKTRLRNGDQVTIITSKSVNPSPAWLGYAITGKAKSSVRRFLRSHRREQYVCLGREILTKGAQDKTILWKEKMPKHVLDTLHLSSLEDVYARVGEGLLSVDALFRLTHPTLFEAPEKPVEWSQPTTSPLSSRSKLSLKSLIPGLSVHYAKCCHPIPGDRIVGIVTTGQGIAIHRTECHILDRFKETPERWMNTSWNHEEEEELFVCRLRILVSHCSGSLAEISSVLGKKKGNITNLRVLEGDTKLKWIILDVELKSVQHLEEIISALRTLKIVRNVERA